MTYTERNCTIEYAGRQFTASGAVVTPGYLLAYPADGGILTDWHGAPIGTWRTISTRPAIFFGRRSWIGPTYYYMRATVDGVTYSLRGFGVGMVARGRRVKS